MKSTDESMELILKMRHWSSTMKTELRRPEKKGLSIMGMVRKVIPKGTRLTAEQEARLSALENLHDEDITFDEDCPRQTAEELAQFRRVDQHSEYRIAR